MHITSLNHKELLARTQLKEDFPFFARNCLKIPPKEPSIDAHGKLQDGLVPFVLNTAQIYLHNIIEEQIKKTTRARVVVLKGRQQGMSTYTGGRFQWRVIHRKASKAFIMAHNQKATENLFGMTETFYSNLPNFIQPKIKKNNADELSFSDLHSGYKVGIASSKGVGRSETVNFLHLSEVSLYENAEEISSGVMQTVPLNYSEIVIESTARGEGNYFHEQWQLAVRRKSDFIAVFVPWHWQKEYSRPLDESFILDEESEYLRDFYKLTNEQMFWRQKKIADGGLPLFKQEYPFNPEEAFKATTEKGIISIELVESARKAKVEPYGPILIGVDCARSENGDRNVIIVRQGRVAYDMSSFHTDDLMSVVSKVVEYIKRYDPRAVFPDVCGVGAGVVDRLRELGYGNIIFPVNAGASAFNKNKYYNKKSEMWGEMLEWFQDGPCQIPDVPSLATDLCSVRWKDNSNSQKVAETTESLKKRMGSKYSPDEAVALLLTFGYPINNLSAAQTYTPLRNFSLSHGQSY